MENFIYVSKVQIARTPKNGHSRKKRKRSAEPGHRGEGEITFFVQQEDSIFEKFAESSFEYACGPKNSLDYVDSNGTAVNTLGAREVRRVFIVPFNALEDIYSEMNEIYPW